MNRNFYTEEPKNSIQLNAIYEMVSKISFDLVKNYEKPEEDSWNNDYWGVWPIDKKEKIIHRPLKISNNHKTLQPWHKILENDNIDLEIVSVKEITNKQHSFGSQHQTIYTLNDNTEILYSKNYGWGGSYRSWNIITTGKIFSQISYDVSLPVCYGNGYDSTNLESLGRLISIREPRIVQVWKETVTYELVFEKKDQLSQITINLTPDITYDSIFLLTFFGSDPNTIEATDNNFPKHIYTSAEDLHLMRLFNKGIEW